MDNGGVSNNDAGTLALLSSIDGGLRGSGFAYDGSVVNNNVQRNADAMRTQHASIIDSIHEQGTDAKLNTILFQNNDFRRETQQQINDARAEAAKCCCETKLLVVKEANDTRTLLLEQQIQSLNSQNEASRDANNTDRIIAAIMATSRGGGNG